MNDTFNVVFQPSLVRHHTVVDHDENLAMRTPRHREHAGLSPHRGVDNCPLLRTGLHRELRRLETMPSFKTHSHIKTPSGSPYKGEKQESQRT